MELPKHTKLIDDFINDNHAMSLLYDTYNAITAQEEKDKFVLALIGHAVVSHQILRHKLREE